MDCRKNRNKNCGCGSYTPTLIDNDTECKSEPCSEIFSTQCIMHTGVDMSYPVEVNNETVNFEIKKGERISDILQRLIAVIGQNNTEIPILNVRNITDTSAVIDIQYGEPVELQYGVAGEVTTVETDSKSYLLENLTSNTDYELKAVGTVSNIESLTFKFRTK